MARGDIIVLSPYVLQCVVGLCGKIPDWELVYDWIGSSWVELDSSRTDLDKRGSAAPTGHAFWSRPAPEKLPE